MPDAADLGNPGVIRAVNMFPGLNGYLPVPSLQTVTGTTTARPRGAIEAVDASNNVFQYVGDETKLYQLSGSTWNDVSLSAYATGTEERWEFVRWKEKILATNFSDNPQSITLGGSNFANMTTALKFRHIAVVGDFVVAGNTFDATDGTVRDRVRWSAFNDETDWTISPTTLSDFRDLKTGGGIQTIVGGQYGVIVSEKSTWRMTFIGSPQVFRIDETVPGIGALSPGSVTNLGENVFMLSNHGFFVVSGGSAATPIGAGRVDQFVLNDIDEDHLHRIYSVADPKSGRLLWAYPGSGNTSGRPNKIVVYDSKLNKWSIINQELELIWRSGGVATTLEELDDFNPGPDLVLTGDFATDTNWIKGTGWTISGTATHAAGTASELSQNITLADSTYYRLQFDVSGRTAGSVTPEVGGVLGTAISADATGIKESIRTSTDNDIAFVATSDFDGSIDNVSVKLINDIDSLSISLDSSQWKGDAAQLSAFTSDFKNANFTGTPITAITETKEVELFRGRKAMLNYFRPLVDGGSVSVRVGSRNSQSDAVSFGNVLTQRPSGRFSTRSNARYHRFELTISGDYTDAVGVQISTDDARKAERR